MHPWVLPILPDSLKGWCRSTCRIRLEWEVPAEAWLGKGHLSDEASIKAGKQLREEIHWQ